MVVEGREMKMATIACAYSGGLSERVGHRSGRGAASRTCVILGWCVILFLAVVHGTSAQASRSNASLEITRCRFEMANDMTSTSFNLNPQPLSNALHVTFTNVLSGTVTATMTCFDDTSSALFTTAFSYEGSSLSAEAVMANLEPVGGQSSVHFPFIRRFRLTETQTEQRAQVLASSLDGNAFQYDVNGVTVDAQPLTPQGCTDTTDACTATYASENPAIIAATATEQGTGETTFVQGSKLELDAGNDHGAFNQGPAVTHIGMNASAIAFGDDAQLTARFLDFDVSNASSSAEKLAYTFSIDHVNASGDVLTSGGGPYCSLSWMSLGDGLGTAGALPSLGPVERELTGVFAPTGPGVPRYCRLSLSVTDWNGVSTSASVTVHVGNSGTVASTGPVASSRDAAQALPLVFTREGLSEGGVLMFIPDKCDGVACPAETQCLHASVCDPGTGVCLAQEPKTGDSCDDGDDTTRDDTCTSQGVCVGTSKCLGVVCEPLSTCHDPGTCIPNLGTCSESMLKPAGAYCDDGDDTTVFDVCDAVGNCQGTDVSDLIRDDEIDFTTVAGADPIRVRSFLDALPNVCCDAEVCCQPCTSGTCGSGDFDNLWYIQTNLA